MHNDLLESLRKLTDADLVERVKDLASRERGVTAQLVAHLAELDTRDVHLRAGYGSLFSYCREVLALSEHEAYNRIEVARAARRFPFVLDLLAAGSVNLTAVRLLAPHLTGANYREVLESARGKRKAEVEEMVAALSPRADAPTITRKLPERRPVAPPSVAPPPVSAEKPSASTPPAAAPRPAVVEALAPERYRLQVTISGATVEKFRLAKDQLRHAIPTGDDATILDRALTKLLEDIARTRFAATDRPRAAKGGAPGSRHVAAEVKRTVWMRDLGRCAFVGAGGRRCDERAFLEFHHVEPFALGGEATVANIELRCRAHNQLEGRLAFGRHGESMVRELALEWLNSFQKKRRDKPAWYSEGGIRTPKG